MPSDDVASSVYNKNEFEEENAYSHWAAFGVMINYIIGTDRHGARVSSA